MTRIAIRVDASTTIGLGHVKRCLSLTEAFLQCGVEVIFVCRSLGVDVRKMVASVGVELVELHTPRNNDFVVKKSQPKHALWACVPWELDVQETVAALSSWRPDWVLIDHYAFDADWHSACRNELKCRLAVVDDLGDRDLVAEVLIDHNYHISHEKKYEKKIPSGTVILGGPQYALLGRKFCNAKRYQFAENVRSIGLFLGGGDPLNWTAKALYACRNIVNFTGEIEVVVTSANPHRSSLAKIAHNDIATLISMDLPALEIFFARHDLQIGAGGGAIWERCCIGSPTVGIVCAENQLLSLPFLHSLCVVEMVGHKGKWREVSSMEIAKSVSKLIGEPKLRQILSENGKGLVDGLGAMRVASWLANSGVSI